ncbi:putative reverse transcriptase domain-containing protein [Tanacetum coccineum]
MGDRRSSEDGVHNISTSIFVTNFPDQTNAKELWRLCNQYGNVIDAFIPNRRSKVVPRMMNVGNNGFSTMDHQWQGDLFAIGGAAQVDTSNHNRSQPVNTFEWGSGSVRCNLAEPNILATYGNDMGITNYGLRLKDEAIKKLKERTQMSKKRLKIWDPEIKRIFKTSP